ncbi:MAG: FlgD immunoglobulin-like domain containing protein [candidate division WOR-3 bacterium]|nr:FlgD immunoglobulin-like domain containing protein [candidate division WOR-3 bacterium]
MRTSSIILISLVSMMVLAIPAHAWVAEPTEETGYYYMYDDQSDPPFTEPELPPLPGYDPIWQDPEAEKFCTYSDYSYRYTMVDSFWYFGVWYEPGDYLWMTDEGYISFDPACEVGDFPNPPIDDPPFPVTDDPNALIAPLWQDNDCTHTPPPSETNRVYYLYDTDDKNLIIEWYRIQGHTSTHEYTFEVVLQMGGQELLEVNECGVLYSGHLIHFLYNTTSHGWDADNGATGFEDQTGEHGITYGGTIEDGRVIRIGYRKVIDHDVAADEIIAPAALVEPNTDVDPITVIGNYGSYAESFDVTLNIYDDEENSVYHNVITLSDEMDVGVDTLGPSEWPLWTPEDPEAHYTAELIVSLNEDQCPANDTLLKDVWTSAGVTETPPSSGFELKVNDVHTIEFSVPYRTKTEIAVYDLNGSKVRTLADRTYPLGTHTLTWDGCDAKGRKIAQGVYLVRMEADEWKATRKVVLY